MLIYIYKNSQQSGPFEESIVSGWLKNGQLSPEDMACRQGDQTWKPLKVFFPNVQSASLNQGANFATVNTRADNLDQKKGGSKIFLYLLLGFGVLILVGAIGIAAIFMMSRSNRSAETSNLSNNNLNSNSSNVNSTNSNARVPNSAELNDKLKEFAKLKPPVKLEKTPILKGKVIVVEQKNRENEYTLRMPSTTDMTNYGISDNQIAVNLAELDTLVQIICGKGRSIGKYGPRMAYIQAYSNICNVSIIDYRASKTFAQKSFVNQKKPKTINVLDGENEFILDAPMEEVEKYLSGLSKE